MKAYKWAAAVMLTAALLACNREKEPDEQGATVRFGVIFNQFQCFTTGLDALEYELWVAKTQEDFTQGNVLEKRRGYQSNQVFVFSMQPGIYWYHVRFDCLCKEDTACVNRGYADYDSTLDRFYRVYEDTFEVFPNKVNDIVRRFY